MSKLFLLIAFLVNIDVLMGQDSKINMGKFYFMPKIELYSLTWMVKGNDFSSRLTWNNNFNTGVLVGYQQIVPKKVFFLEMGLSNTISGSGTDIDKFYSGSEIKSEFQSDRSMFISLRTGVELIRESKEKLVVAIQLAKDNLKLHSEAIPDLNSRYVIRKYDFDVKYKYTLDILNTISEIVFQGGIGYNYAVATWNKIESLKQPKSFDHSLFVNNLGVGANIEISPIFSLNLLVQNSSLITGNERTFVKQGDVQRLRIKDFNQRLINVGVKFRIDKY